MNTQLRNESLTGQMNEKRKELSPSGRRIGDMHAVDEFRMKTLEAENEALRKQRDELLMILGELAPTPILED